MGRSDRPLYQTIGRPVAWSVDLTTPAGVALDLTGTTVEAWLSHDGTDVPLEVGPLGNDGRAELAGEASLTDGMLVGIRSARLKLKFTDSQGSILDFSWDVVGERP